MSNSFRNLKADYFSSRLPKADFIVEAHQRFYKVLFEIAAELINTDISRIEITDNQIRMTSRLNNISMIVDNLDQRTAAIEILNFNRYEPNVSAFVSGLAPAIDTMLDIGANIGWYSCLVSGLNPAAVVHAFEPIPSTFKILQANCGLNNTQNVHCHNYGLSSSAGTFFLYYYPEGSGNASLQNLTNRDDASKIECELKTLDQFMLTLHSGQHIDFIKCDVEGNELFVIQGGISVLKKHKPIVLLELLRKWSAPFGYHPNDVLELLNKLGYICYICTENSELVQIASVNESTNETNFLFVHPESRLRSSLLYS